MKNVELGVQVPTRGTEVKVLNVLTDTEVQLLDLEAIEAEVHSMQGGISTRVLNIAVNIEAEARDVLANTEAIVLHIRAEAEALSIVGNPEALHIRAEAEVHNIRKTVTLLANIEAQKRVKVKTQIVLQRLEKKRQIRL